MVITLQLVTPLQPSVIKKNLQLPYFFPQFLGSFYQIKGQGANCMRSLEKGNRAMHPANLSPALSGFYLFFSTDLFVFWRLG